FAAGTPTDAAVAAVPAQLILERTTLTADPVTSYQQSKYQSSLLAATQELLPGEVATVSDDTGGGVIVLRGVSRSPRPKRAFAAVEHELRSAAEDGLFERWLDDRVAEADIEITDQAPR